MSQDKKQISFNATGDVNKAIEEIMEKNNLTKTEAINFIVGQFQRYGFEQSSSESQNFKKIQGYFDSISSVFQTIVDGADSRVESSVKEVFEYQQKYEVQVQKYQNLKDETDQKIKEQQTELKRLNRELETYVEWERTVEDQISDKAKIIESKDAIIVSMTEKQEKLEEENNKLDEFKAKILELEVQLEDSVQQLRDKEYEKKDALHDLRSELQKDHQEKIEKIYDAETEKKEKIRQDLENRLREEHLKDVERIRSEHQEELERVRSEYKMMNADNIKNLEEEVYDLQQKLIEKQTKVKKGRDE
ncbi:hypothetical protein [Pseudalkalibacillus hwajinpoensis]|uniref:hypothetical protein n=1 Tax=Guptibacillus hwajinpoensis TaxID=208199 RepID=UPI00384CFF84